jgi:hypothetical protein
MAGGYGGTAGEAKVTQTLTVTPGDRLTIIVGSAGQGSAALAGSVGTNSSIRVGNNIIVANGGVGGLTSTDADTTGGASGFEGYGAGGAGGTGAGSAGSSGTDGYASITWG